MELDQPSHIVNVLAFCVLALCDHFMRHIMVYVTPDLTAKNIAKFLWQGHISIFTAPVKLLSDQGANFESNIISELFELMGIWKVINLLYHCQTNEQVEWATKHWGKWLENWVKIRRQTGPSTYQNWYMLTISQDWLSPDTSHIIWCLGNDCAYPSTFIFTPSQTQKNTSVSITMLLTYVSNCIKPSRRHKHSPHLRLKGRGNTMIIKLMPFHWSQTTLSWLKLMPTKGVERWKTGRGRNWVKWNVELPRASLPTSWKNRRLDTHKFSTGIDFFSLPP